MFQHKQIIKELELSLCPSSLHHDQFCCSLVPNTLILVFCNSVPTSSGRFNSNLRYDLHQSWNDTARWAAGFTPHTGIGRQAGQGKLHAAGGDEEGIRS